MAAVHSARRWPLPALRWLSTAYVTVLPHRLPHTTGRSGIQRPPWLARATVATIAPPAVATAAAGHGIRRRRSVSGTQRQAPSSEVQALLDQYGIDVQKVVRRYPHVANYDVQRVERMVSYLAGLGLDVKRVVEKDPAILAGRLEAYEAVIQLLRRNGVNITHMISSNPAVFHRPVTTLQHILDAILSSGHSPADVLRHYPYLLRSSAANVSSTLQILQQPPSATSDSLSPEDPKGMLLRSLGLDADILLRKAPQLLVLTYNKLNATVVYLESVGVDVPRAVRLAPRVLGRPPEALQQRMQFLSENGLDALRHVKGCPTLFNLSIERTLRPMLTFMLEEMGRSTADLDKTPSIWGYDLQGRLRPRFLFLESLGKSPASLNQFATTSDQRFATTVAGTDLQRYYDWRRQNGYSVPLGTVTTPAATSGGVCAVPPLVSGNNNNKQNELQDDVC